MDFLKFKYPGNDVVSYAGKLIKFSDKPADEGFLITDFTTNNLYRFAVTALYDENVDYPIHLSTEVPIVYTKEEYIEYANSFLDEIRANGFQKVVFSRVKEVPFNAEDTILLFNELCIKYPDSFVYLLSSELMGTWIGVSPEYVLERMGKEIYTISLAGTKKDENLKWTEKEILEQEYVTNYIEDVLMKINVDNLKTVGPYDFQAGPVVHLKTDIYAETEVNTLELALSLHPTPAVSGLPKKESIELIHKYEKHERKLYTGMMGYYSAHNCSLYVNIRCAQIQKDNAYLYLGGGFTKDSVVEKEWDETENKALTLMSLMEKK